MKIESKIKLKPKKLKPMCYIFKKLQLNCMDIKI